MTLAGQIPVLAKVGKTRKLAKAKQGTRRTKPMKIRNRNRNREENRRGKTIDREIIHIDHRVLPLPPVFLLQCVHLFRKFSRIENFQKLMKISNL